jgi:site-specific DNA recombinase
MRAAIYIRVSTQEQAMEGFSVPAQRHRAAAFCDSQGWTVVGIYTDDGKSAKDTNRPELQRMLADADDNLFDVIVVYKLDRLTRSVLDLYEILARIDKRGIKFKSVTEMYDTTTATGRLFITLVAALAQWERENLAERVYFGMEEMVRQGSRPGGTTCYGYDMIDGKMRINEAQARIVRRIFDAYEATQGMRAIQQQLEAERIPPPNKHWSTTTINYMLRNPVYIGKLRWNLRKRGKGKTGAPIIVDGQHEPIISKVQFERVQRLLDRRRTLPPVAATSDFAYSGILRCGRCGYAMSGTSRKYKSVRTKYYACVNRQKNFKCSMPYIREDVLEDAFMQHVKRQLEEHCDVEIEPESEIDVDAAIADLNRRLQLVAERKRKFQTMYVDELISRDDFLLRRTELEAEEKSLRDALEEIADVGDGDGNDITAAELLDMITNCGDADKKAIMQEMVKEIKINNANRLDNGSMALDIEVTYN